MTEEERLRKQVKVLETEMYYKEKEMLRVYRELDRYRRKCDFLRLKSRPHRSSSECAVQTDEKPRVLTPTPEPVPVEPPPQPPVPVIATPPKPRTRRSTISRMLNGEEPFNKSSAEEKLEQCEEAAQKTTPRPAKRKAAYMEPYAPVKFQAAYTPTHLQPAAITPLYESLQRKEAASVKWREHFQLLKVMYLSKETFCTEDVAVLREVFSGQRPAPVATFLVQELSEASDVLHFGDAFELALSATSDLVGRDPVWDASFLKSLRALATETTEQRRFLGCKRKMPSTAPTPDEGTVLTLIVFWHTHFCAVSELPASHRDLLVMLLSRGNVSVAGAALARWESASGLYCMKVIAALLEGKKEHLMQEVAVRVSVASIGDEQDISKALKVMFRANTPEEAYQFYSSHLWNVFISSFPDSVPRKLILKSLGHLVQVITKAHKPNAVRQLVQSLEEILSDTTHQSEEYTAFSEAEQRAAAHSLRKSQPQSTALAQWLSSHS